jgi:flagellar motor switch protein FliM
MNTPNKDAWKERLGKLDKTNLTDLDKLEVGDFVLIKYHVRNNLTGFVKKISKINVIIETTYGGMGGNDVVFMELKEPKIFIKSFLKPKK